MLSCFGSDCSSLAGLHFILASLAQIPGLLQQWLSLLVPAPFSIWLTWSLLVIASMLLMFIIVSIWAKRRVNA